MTRNPQPATATDPALFRFVNSFRYDQQGDAMRQQSFNMEQATMAIQTAKDTHVVVSAMKAGVSQMKKEYKKINIDNIEVCFLLHLNELP
jgi:charged multivesicular body protein 5